jgi:glycosyltransferase involved in cell wall biosynthesis
MFPFVGDSVGGSHHSVIELYRELRKNDIPSFLVVHKKGPLTLFLDDIGIPYEYMPIYNLAGENPNIFLIFYSMLTNFFRIYRYISCNKISIVHGNDLRINLTWSLPTRFSRASYIWHQRTTLSNSYYWNLINILADRFVTISHYVHNTLPSNIQDSKKNLVLNPFDTLTIYDKTESRYHIQSTYNLPEKAFIVGYVGRLVEWKNVDSIIKFLSAYSNTSLYLLIVGTGKDKYVSNLKKLSNNNSIVFTGFVNNPSKIIAGLDLIIAPSNTEPFGRTLVEAMIQKTPVLASRSGGHMEIIKHELTGWLYDNGDVENFITQLENIMNRSEIVEKVVQNAHEFSCSKYSSFKHYKNIVNIYHRSNN